MSTVEFILSDFWRFIGTLILLVVILQGLAEIVSAWRRK